MERIRAIGYNLANLINFKGRTPRSQFWPYVAFVHFVMFAGMAAIMLPEISASIERMRKFAAEHPDQVTVRNGPGHYSITFHGNHPELMPDIGRATPLMIAAFVGIILLLSAAVVRRLHDRGMSGAWGLAPIPFVVFAVIMMPKLFDQFGRSTLNPDLFFALFINNLLYAASLIFLAVLLSGVSTKGKNRYE